MPSKAELGCLRGEEQGTTGSREGTVNKGTAGDWPILSGHSVGPFALKRVKSRGIFYKMLFLFLIS